MPFRVTPELDTIPLLERLVSGGLKLEKRRGLYRIYQSMRTIAVHESLRQCIADAAVAMDE